MAWPLSIVSKRWGFQDRGPALAAGGPVRAVLSEEIPENAPPQKTVSLVGLQRTVCLLFGSVISERGVTFSVLRMEVFHLTAVDPRSSPSILSVRMASSDKSALAPPRSYRIDGCEVRKFRINHFTNYRGTQYEGTSGPNMTHHSFRGPEPATSPFLALSLLVGRTEEVGGGRVALNSAKEFGSWRCGLSLRERSQRLDRYLSRVCRTPQKRPHGLGSHDSPSLTGRPGHSRSLVAASCLSRVVLVVKGAVVAQRSFPCPLHRARQPPLPRLGRSSGVLETKQGVSNATKPANATSGHLYRDRQDIAWATLRRQHTKCASHCLRRTSLCLQATSALALFAENRLARV